MYVMICSRPDIAYLVSNLSIFVNNLILDNWKAIKSVLKYLKCILDYGLHYTGYPTTFERQSDTN